MKQVTMNILKSKVEKILEDKTSKYVVPKGAAPDDYADIEERALYISIDINTIRQQSPTPMDFFKKCCKYFKNRPKMAEKGLKPKLQAQKITMITIIGELVHKSCDKVGIDPMDVEISLNNEGSLSLKVDSSKVSRDKIDALHSIADLHLEQRGYDVANAVVIEKCVPRYIEDEDGNMHDLKDLKRKFDMSDDIVGEA